MILLHFVINKVGANQFRHIIFTASIMLCKVSITSNPQVSSKQNMILPCLWSELLATRNDSKMTKQTQYIPISSPSWEGNYVIPYQLETIISQPLFFEWQKQPWIFARFAKQNGQFRTFLSTLTDAVFSVCFDHFSLLSKSIRYALQTHWKPVQNLLLFSIWSQMALQISLSSPIRSSPSPQHIPFSDHRVHCLLDGSSRPSKTSMTVNITSSRRMREIRASVNSSLDMAEPVIGQVTEVNKDTFWPLVQAAGDKTVVLDMYTQWYIFNMTQLLLLYLGLLMNHHA